MLMSLGYQGLLCGHHSILVACRYVLHLLLGTYPHDVYDDSSINHSVPGGGGSVLFHTHTFSHFTGTYALLQLPFCMDSDVGCLYRCPFGMNPAIA